MRGLTSAVLASALGAACLGVLGVTVAPPAAAEDPDCMTTPQDAPGSPLDPATPVLTQLEIGRAQKLVEDEAPARSGPPVRVAVLDSGVTGDRIPVADRYTGITGRSEVMFPHGTVVAGLIAGERRDDTPVGIAPDAEIVDVRVYDDEDREEGGETVSSASLAAGLEWVAQEARGLNIKIANVAIAVEDDEDGRLERAVRAVRRAGVVVVAAAGNRPEEGQPFDTLFGDDGPEPDEDAADHLFPTGYDDVVSVSATSDGSPDPDASAYVLRNSNTTVAAPTYWAVSYAVNGEPCRIPTIATSWATAEVSGVLALLFRMFPGDTDEQVVARLVATANGTPDDPNPVTGAGVVQPVEALTRPLAPARSGEIDRAVSVDRAGAPAVAPDPETDPLAGPRDDAVWWGLIGGGILVVALLLRPVLARRRT